MRFRAHLIVLAVTAVLISSILPAEAGSDMVDRYTRLVATGDVTFTPEGRTQVSDIVGAELVVDAVGNVVDRLPFKAKPFDRPLAATMARVPCVHDNTREGFKPHTPPAQYPINKKNEKGMFKFHFYSQDNARTNAVDQQTVQFLSCAAGGVDAENGSRITISGPGVAFNSPNTSYILGHRWREGKTPKDYSISLGFEVPLRAVKITGSIQQEPSNSLRGSILPPYGGHEMAEYHENGVNAWWEEGCRPRCTRFGGSNHYQGSVGEGLWEFPQWRKGEVLKRGFKIAAYMEHFCANPFGC